MDAGNPVSNVKKIVDGLNAGWRNEVAKQLGADTNTFQLAQGVLGLQTADSSGLFRMADAVPSNSQTQYYDPSSARQFSSGYNGMLHALLPSESSGLRATLGPMYASWIAYRSADTSSDTQEEVFKRWANKNLDPGKISSALTAYQAAATDPLYLAYDAFINKANYTPFVDDANQPYSLPTYSCTITNAKTAVATGGSATINFDSTTMDTTSVGTTVSGSASGFYEFFSGGASGSFDSLNTTAASSEFTITGTIDKYGTVSCDRSGWYTSDEYTRAFGGEGDNNIWDPLANQGGWDSFFGAQGAISRRVTELLLVSGYDITVTSKAKYSASQFQKITTTANVGFWPFFSAEVSTTHTTKYTQGADGSLIVNYKLNPGLIAIWGATVANAPD